MIEANIAKANKGLGLVQDEFAKLAVTISKQSGKAPGADLIGAGQTASTARALGIDLDLMANFTGRQSALTGTGVADQAIMIGRAVGKYGVVRTEKLLEDISQFSEKQVDVTATASDKQIRAFTEFRAFAESQGPLVGEAVSKVISNMSDALMKPGGGLAGEMFMQEYARRRGAKDPYEGEYIREEGLFTEGPDGKLGIDVISKMLEETSMSHYQKLAMSKTLGFGSAHQMETTLKAWKSFTPQERAKFLKTYEDKIAKGETPDIAAYSKISNMSDAEVKAAYEKSGMKGARTTEGMRDALLKNTTMEKTPASMLTDAVTELRNAVIALAKNAIPPLIAAAELEAVGAKMIGIIVEDVGTVMMNVGAVIKGALESLNLISKKEEAMTSLGDAFTDSDVEQEGDEKTGLPGFRENETQKKRVAEKNKKAIALAAAGDKEGFLKYIRENAPGVREDEAVKMYNALSAQTETTKTTNEKLADLKATFDEKGSKLADVLAEAIKAIKELVASFDKTSGSSGGEYRRRIFGSRCDMD